MTYSRRWFKRLSELSGFNLLTRRVRRSSAPPILMILLACVVMPARAELLLDIDGIHFGPGDTLTLSIGLNGTAGMNQPADVYLAVLPPVTNSVLFISGGPGLVTVTPGQITDPDSWTPLAENVVLSEIGDTKLLPWLTLPIPEGAATGDFRFAFAVTQAGTLTVIDSQFAVIRVLENSIKANLGLFEGEWHNTTFGSTGGTTYRIRELAPGELEYILDLDGFVGGFTNPAPETRQFSLADLSGLVDFEIKDPEHFKGPYSFFIAPDGEMNFDVSDIGIFDFFTFSANGARVGDTVNLDYQVRSKVGLIAVGTVTATRSGE